MPHATVQTEARKIGIAVVGLGFMGAMHLRAYQQIPAARIHAVCGRSRLPVNGVLSGVGGNLTGAGAIQLDHDVAVYRNFEDVLGDPAVEVVDLCVPTPLHAPHAVAALRAGKHVLCEKPLARTGGQAREIVQASQSSQGFFMPAMCLRFWPEWMWLKQAVAQSSFGKVLAARFRRVSEPPQWGREFYFDGSQSGGALFDLHIHDVDFIQHLFGRPERLFATGRGRFSGAVDHVVTQFCVASGATVSAEASWLMPPGSGFSMAYAVNFERATADYDSSRGAEALQLCEEGKPPRVIPCPGPDGYVGELRYFIESVFAGAPPTVVTAADGLSAVEICEAIERSVKTGEVIRLAT